MGYDEYRGKYKICFGKIPIKFKQTKDMIIWEPKRKNLENRNAHLKIKDITAGYAESIKPTKNLRAKATPPISVNPARQNLQLKAQRI